MIKSLWINLPVTDINKSKAFFEQIGFELNTQYGVREDSASFFVGQHHFVLMLFEQSLYEGFAGAPVSHDQQTSNMLLSIDAESVAEVDELARKVVEAGGSLYGKPGYQDGWMYGCGFIDLDGQRWSILYMDFSKMPLGDEDEF